MISSPVSGGGASTGIELAVGRPVDIAINHDPAAIAMHKANHPFTKHYCESVWDVDPRKATEGKPVGLMWLSPACIHFSRARGGTPVTKQMRGLAWVAVRWAATVRPRVVILENVSEFQTWARVINGQPDKKQSGRIFNSFVNALRYQGYAVDWRELRACDYGAPTIRKRLFLIARRDGEPIVWPKPTHAAPESPEVRKGKLKPWRTATEIIDWSIPCPSIFDTAEEIWQKYHVRAVRPLAEATLRRIARGIQKFVIDNPEPYIIKFQQNSIGQKASQPLDTVMAGATRFGVVAPTLIQYHGGQDSREIRGQAINAPLMTADTSNRYGLVTAFISKFYGTSTGQPMTEPLHTVTVSPGHFGEVRALLIKYYGNGGGQLITEPLHTITGNDRFGLVTIRGEQYAISDIGLRMLTPRELFNAQGFPADYCIDVGPNGEPISKADQVARCGNSVPPPFAEALVRANLPEMCGKKISSMAELEKEMAV